MVLSGFPDPDLPAKLNRGEEPLEANEGQEEPRLRAVEWGWPAVWRVTVWITIVGMAVTTIRQGSPVTASVLVALLVYTDPTLSDGVREALARSLGSRGRDADR